VLLSGDDIKVVTPEIGEIGACFEPEVVDNVRGGVAVELLESGEYSSYYCFSSAAQTCCGQPVRPRDGFSSP